MTSVAKRLPLAIEESAETEKVQQYPGGDDSTDDETFNYFYTCGFQTVTKQRVISLKYFGKQTVMLYNLEKFPRETREVLHVNPTLLLALHWSRVTG